jgi:hypothetical protein
MYHSDIGPLEQAHTCSKNVNDNGATEGLHLCNNLFEIISYFKTTNIGTLIILPSTLTILTKAVANSSFLNPHELIKNESNSGFCSEKWEIFLLCS